ncbi:MAG: hypothetical protein KA388_07465 [Rhodocyclaceae bacterium]|nr:hypothetical protein [Rhodocyclaceae bacterium]MBL0076819.1 hypothetical protein [Rhodocyclaceae bacterium]MBP6110199.1 hypothetical protein [Rhodocyclaceae bacterium]MBP6279581.1 hypothetical protein [Rhodocyclaceae bacterium]
MMRMISVVLWPAFLVGGIAEGLFFTVINPQELYLFGHPVTYSPLATYSIGFFAFWALCAASSALTFLLLRSAEDINRQA